MLVWKRILILKQQIADQRKWIESCGGDRQGYIDRYGDPGLPPLATPDRPNPAEMAHEKHRIVRIPAEDRHLAAGLRPVLDVPECEFFYVPHSGAGGSLIYEADVNRLRSLETELADYQIRCHGAWEKARGMEGKFNARREC